MSEKSFRIDLDTKAMDDLMVNLGNEMQAAARPAAQAGAQVLYDEVKRNVGRIMKTTGNLDRSIYQVFAPEKSMGGLRPTYNVSWNYTKAPHGHLVEYGHWQHFQAKFIKGRWVTLVRPEMRGKPKPKRRAPLAEKLAYYVPRKGGSQYIAAQPFMRPAQNKFPEAAIAMEEELLRYLNGKTPDRNT